MVLDLFTGASLNRSSGGRRRATPSTRSSVGSGGGGGHRSTQRRRTSRSHDDTVGASVDRGSAHVCNSEDRILFNNCVSQVQRNLKAHSGSPSTLHTLASYYTKVEPFIENRPFCVSLSYATFLFHMQMARISLFDVELYVTLISSVMSQIRLDDQLHHPFVQQVLRDHVFGLPSPTCRGGAHCIVLLPPQQYNAFANMATSLVDLDVIPLDVVYQFQDRLEKYCNAAAPLVANRALALLVQTVHQVRMDEQITALQYVLKTKPVKMNVDFLIACFERLKRSVTDPANGPTFGRALSVHCSELFLRFRSPIRREYVERFLYPSLCHSDMTAFLQIPATRHHLLHELLSQCTPGMGTGNPFYMCLCAVMQSSFDNETDGALEAVALINCRMPHAAYYMATLAVDSHMSVAMYAKIVIALARGVGMAMTGREMPDEVAASISKNRTSVYNVLFLIREVVRGCSVIASRRSTDMLTALRIAVPPKTIDALGKLSSEAFDGVCDIMLDPQLLCAEVAMVLHHDHILEAMDSAVEYFKDVTSKCAYCGAVRSASLLCPVNGTVHVAGQSSVSRVLSTLAECAGAKVVEEKLISYLRDPAMQMEHAVHYLLYYLISNGGQHRSTLFVAIEPYVRSTLLALVSADRSSARGFVSSALKANVLMLHVKLVTLLSSSIEPSYLESILKVFAELKLRNNHDALALWYMGNILLRNCKANLELLPSDPRENNYCVEYPGCAPSSATTADNAQLVLKLLHRAHSFSSEMNKLVGCCVCKLIQDFNMQAPNVVGALLSPFGFLPVSLASLNTFALPSGANSTFWNFFLTQMRLSAPARTAFMAALVKSMSQRFRVASPVDALTPHGVDPTGHLFAIMMYEAMKRSPPLARVVLFMVTSWMKQADHPPGKYACLVYVCVQLVTVVLERGAGPAGVELEAETPQDRHQFEDSVKKAAKVLKSQQTRLEKLAPTVRRENVEFFQLLRRLQRRTQRTVAAANGESVVDDDDDEPNEYEGDDSFRGTRGCGQRDQHGSLASDGGDSVYALRELQNAEDDGVFGDYVDVGDTDEENGEGFTHYGDSVVGVEGYEALRPAHRLQPQTLTGILRTGDHPSDAVRRTAVGGEADTETGSPAFPNAIETTASAKLTNDAVSVTDDAGDMPLREKGQSRLLNSTQCGAPAYARGGERYERSTSRGVQTEEPSAPSHLQQGTAAVLPKGTLQRSVGTSPLVVDRSTLSAVERSRTQPPFGPQTDNFSASEVQSSGDNMTVGGGAWREPDLEYDIEGDTTPIDNVGIPHLQATTVDGTVLPSGLVLEYLRTHQGMDSLRHELEQLDHQRVTQHVADYVAHYAARDTAAPQSSHTGGTAAVLQLLTVEGRTNNYSRPHVDPSQLAPSRTVRAAVQVTGTSTRYSHSHVVQGAQLAMSEVSDTVDGEHHLHSVSGEDPLIDEAKRHRAETIVPPSPASQFRGRNFFLNQQNNQNIASALQDIHGLQRQTENLAALSVAQQRNDSGNGADQDSATTAIATTAPGSADGVQAVENPPSRPTPHTARETLPPTTPYGQVILPTWVVEQGNDTAIREVRQVMGAYNPNDARLSTGGGRSAKIRGSGNGSSGTARSSSAAWWTEMSSTPMPSYAADPQYSMELF